MKLEKVIGFGGSVTCALRDLIIASLGLTAWFMWSMMRGASLSVRVMKIRTSLRENEAKFREGVRLHDD